MTLGSLAARNTWIRSRDWWITVWNRIHPHARLIPYIHAIGTNSLGKFLRGRRRGGRGDEVMKEWTRRWDGRKVWVSRGVDAIPFLRVFFFYSSSFLLFSYSVRFLPFFLSTFFVLFPLFFPLSLSFFVLSIFGHPFFLLPLLSSRYIFTHSFLLLSSPHPLSLPLSLPFPFVFLCSSTSDILPSPASSHSLPFILSPASSHSPLFILFPATSHSPSLPPSPSCLLLPPFPLPSLDFLYLSYRPFCFFLPTSLALCEPPVSPYF